MNALKARLFRVGCLFGISGFLLGFVCSGEVIQLWAAALGRFFVPSSSTDLLWARFRFSTGFALLAAAAPFAAALFPRINVTVRRSLIYFGLSTGLCVVSLFIVRSMCAQLLWDATYTTLFARLPAVSDFPLFFCPTVSAALTLALAWLLRFASSRRAFRHMFSRHSQQPRYEY